MGPAAHAETPLATPAAIDVDRDDTPPGRTELGFDGGAPVEGWGITASAGWLERPVTFTDGAGTETRPVRRRQTLRLGGAIALGASVVIDARVPLSHQVGDRLRATGDARALDRWVAGDLRLGGRIRVAGSADRAVFVRADLSLPTGHDGDFAGEPSWSVAWRLIGRITLPEGIVVAGTLGIRLRGAEVLVADRLVGDELVAALGAAVPVPAVRPLWRDDHVKLTAEVVAIMGNDVGIGTGPSPVEARAGVVTHPRPDLAIGIRIGTGLTDEIGAPRLRAMLELTYQGRAQAAPTTSSRR